MWYISTEKLPLFTISPAEQPRVLCDSERIVEFHGSQCGFCTPGIVVACHATLLRAAERGIKPTPDDMQTGLDGNLCRCTGYRPILDACKVQLAWYHGLSQDLGELQA